MAHYHAPRLIRPQSFNFATHALDHWATALPLSTPALLWASHDLSDTRTYTYAAISVLSHRLAVLLTTTLDLRPGDRMVLITPRVPVWWALAVACLRTGVVLCPGTTQLVGGDIGERCRRAGAKVFVGDAERVRRFMSVRGSCPSVRAVVCVEEEEGEGDDRGGAVGGEQGEGGEVLRLGRLLDAIPRDARYQGPQPKVTDPSLIYFTSGTTGHPKMVLHNQISYPLAHVVTGKHWLRLAPGKVYWNLSEQGWAKAAWSFLGAWNCGAALFVHDDRSAFDPRKTLAVLHRFPITTLCAPPTVYRQLVLKDMRGLFKSSRPKCLEHCTGAGEPLNAEVIQRWQEMCGIGICDGYGQTETILVCGNYAGAPIRPGSMGKPSPDVPLHVIRDNGEEAGVGEEGNIAIAIDTTGNGDFFGIYDGYINEDGSLHRPLQKAADGRSWYKTGDRARRDKDGYFWFVGRSDDVINSAGYRIGPFEVESTLKQHPAVVESAVVASPDPDRGEVVKAFVVLTREYANKGNPSLVKDLQDFCKVKAAPYKYPRKIQFVDSSFLPKTISGKIKRSELKKMEWRTGKAKL